MDHSQEQEVLTTNNEMANHEGGVGQEFRPDDQRRGEVLGDPLVENRSGEVSNEQGDTYDDNGWATRNPMKSVIPSRMHKKLTEAERASRGLITEANKTTRALLMQDVDAFLEDQAKQIDVLATKHSVKAEYIKKLVNPITTYKKQRAPTLHNAIAHIKAVEIGKGEILD